MIEIRNGTPNALAFIVASLRQARHMLPGGNFLAVDIYNPYFKPQPIHVGQFDGNGIYRLPYAEIANPRLAGNLYLQAFDLSIPGLILTSPGLDWWDNEY